jgi:predicted 2-oxoglutarate/Fe(II)-dependent dioxygenase YbiX
VTTIVYLGHEDADTGGERGGVLQFRGLIPDPRVADRAYAFTPAVGTLLAFPSTALHEVTPILQGERYSLVAWFC